MSTQFIQEKMMVKFNKQITAINAIAEGTRVFQTWTKEDIENGQYISSSEIQYNDKMLRTVREERIVRHAPHDIESRLEESGLDMTWENVVDECKYLKSVIEDGGSFYEEEDTTDLMNTLDKIIKWSEKLTK